MIGNGACDDYRTAAFDQKVKCLNFEYNCALNGTIGKVTVCWIHIYS